MYIYPAIDLFRGQAVRLTRGDYNQMTVYDTDPVGVAKRFFAAGARKLHIVDLEGAKDGATSNYDIITAILAATPLEAEIGGGIRSLDTVEKYVSAGAERVILGTAAIEDPAFLRAAAKEYGGHIAVGVDIKDGEVAIHGWTEKSGIDAYEFCEKMQAMGVKTLICTDISKDGAMQGTNHALYQELARRCDMQIVASGGVSSMEDVKKLREKDLYGAIIGKAWYTGAIDLKEAIEVAK